MGDADQPQHTVVVIEDEVAIANAVQARLVAEGFVTHLAFDGLTGVELCRRVAPDLVVLDLMLPGIDGLEVCRRIQGVGRVPVLMLTARDHESDLLLGLEVGADDYMVKPFSPRELVARIRAILRRVDSPHAAGRDPASSPAQVGDVMLDPRTRTVTRSGTDVHLTPTEFDLVFDLHTRRGAVAGRDVLLLEVWGYASDAGARTVDSHVRAVRRKLGDDIIRTVHGVGYAIGHGEATP